MTALKVLHLIEDLGLGGAERLLTTLLPRLRDRGIAPEVASLGPREDLVPVLRQAGVPVHVAGFSRPRQLMAAPRWIHDLLKRGRYDALHTHLARANLSGRVAASLAGVPVTSTYHDTDYEPEVLGDNPGHRRWKQKAYQLADGLSIRACPRVVAVSHYVARSIARRLHIPPDRVQVVYNGVPGDLVQEVPEATHLERRRELGLPATARVVLQVGRLCHQKGQKDTLIAAKHLREERDVLWVLVGEGPLWEDLERVRASEGLQERVRLAGGQREVVPFLQAADVFVFPSVHEGLGIAALEAMAVGLPVVAYGIGPLREFIQEGRTGLLLPPGDCIGLAEAVRSLVWDRETAAAMGARGRRVVQEGFLIDATADGHAELYRGLVGA